MIKLRPVRSEYSLPVLNFKGKVLSVVAPMTQLNTPYPSTAYITGFLRTLQCNAVQEDLAIKLVLKLLHRDSMVVLRDHVLAIEESDRSASLWAFADQFDAYLQTVNSVVRFLQGKDPTLAYRIISRTFLPEGPRFAQSAEDFEAEDPLAWAFGAMGLQDRAKHLATLYLNDLADVIRDAVDSRFEFVRYGESLAASQSSFDSLAAALEGRSTWVDQCLIDLTKASIAHHQPQVVLLSVPFPGAVYGALRIAQTIKNQDPKIFVVLGGGYVNTELRELSEPRVFDFVDAICLDSGEAPLTALLNAIEREGENFKGNAPHDLVRTFLRHQGKVVYRNGTIDQPPLADPPFDDVGTPTWDGLALQDYLALLDMLNPMHRLWSDGRWNKITVAHGCYWKKCSFCDVSLDYISRYEAANATVLVDRIEAIVRETGNTGFHLVDEAAPPKALRAMAEELIRRELNISWWGNIRFEKSFTPQLCELLARSGCIAISGGLEVASDRLLALMNKGVTVAQVARVTRALTDSGILVHAYLMYGFPTQTEQETVDALEYVRQLFEQGCLQSGFWHRFSCTVHSPVGKDPKAFGVELTEINHSSSQPIFARNDIGFVDPTGVDHQRLGQALNKALYNYMHGVGLDVPAKNWFAEFMPSRSVPKITVPKHFIAKALASTQE